ncbi:hypothetical protein VTO42DRAFT_7948 [Malbranchea cinnamomea]
MSRFISSRISDLDLDRLYTTTSMRDVLVLSPHCLQKSGSTRRVKGRGLPSLSSVHRYSICHAGQQGFSSSQGQKKKDYISYCFQGGGEGKKKRRKSLVQPRSFVRSRFWVTHGVPSRTVRHQSSHKYVHQGQGRESSAKKGREANEHETKGTKVKARKKKKERMNKKNRQNKPREGKKKIRGR